MDNSELKERLDIISGWISNCDQKSSIMLAVIAFVSPLVFNAETINIVSTLMIEPIKTHFCDIEYFSWRNLLLCICAAVSTVSLFVSAILLILSLTAKVSTKDYSKPGLTSNSLMHFANISKMGYDKFKNDLSKQSDDSKTNDILSQIYINSSICTCKFKYYKVATKLVLVALISFFVDCIIYLILF